MAPDKIVQFFADGVRDSRDLYQAQTFAFRLIQHITMPPTRTGILLARDAREFGTSEQLVSSAARPRDFGVARTPQRDGRRAHRRRQMHRAAVIGDQQVAPLEPGSQEREIGAAR
jgi:hypothetical protein